MGRGVLMERLGCRAGRVLALAMLLHTFDGLAVRGLAGPTAWGAGSEFKTPLGAVLPTAAGGPRRLALRGGGAGSDEARGAVRLAGLAALPPPPATPPCSPARPRACARSPLSRRAGACACASDVWMDKCHGERYACAGRVCCGRECCARTAAVLRPAGSLAKKAPKPAHVLMPANKSSAAQGATCERAPGVRRQHERAGGLERVTGTRPPIQSRTLRRTEAPACTPSGAPACMASEDRGSPPKPRFFGVSFSGFNIDSPRIPGV